MLNATFTTTTNPTTQPGSGLTEVEKFRNDSKVSEKSSIYSKLWRFYVGSRMT